MFGCELMYIPCARARLPQWAAIECAPAASETARADSAGTTLGNKYTVLTDMIVPTGCY
jgi:hypothetical protein